MSFFRHAGCMYQNEYFVSGGYEKQDYVYAYNPNTDHWRKVVPLNYGRDSHVMTVVGDRIYVIGGDGPDLPIEFYEGKTEKWTITRPLSPGIASRLYLPGVVVKQDKIYLFGGWIADDEATDEIL